MRVSVCMATYNGGRYIKEQLDSILSQLSNEDEVIISDDGSTDNTINIIESYHDSRIKLFHHSDKPARKRHYHILNVVTKNFENALNHATGEYIFLSDQDDIWYPNKVSRTLSELAKYDFVISSYNKIDGEGRPYQGEGHGNSERFDKLLRKGFLVQWLTGPHFGCVCAMTKRFKDFALPIPDYPIHDRYLGLLAKRMDVLHHVEEPLILYRRHGNNNSAAENNNFLLKMWMRLKLLYYVVIRPYIKNY